MAPSASPASSPLPESEWPTPPRCPGSPLCAPPATRARAPDRCDYVFHTTAGDVTVRAYRALAPHGADRLHALALGGYYDGSALYRVLPGFVAQFGVAAEPSLASTYDWRENAANAVLPEEEPLDASIAASGHGNAKLWLSYSASYDESTGLATNRTAELFVNLADNRDALDAKGFRAFAKVVDGADVIDKWYSGYGEMADACDLHPERGFRCDGPSEARLYAEGAAYVASEFPLLDRVGAVTVRPDPADGGPAWFYGNAIHHYSWSDGGPGAGVAWWLALALCALALVRVYTRHAEVAERKRRARGEYAPDELNGARDVARAVLGRKEKSVGDRLAETLETFTTPVSQPRGQGEDDANARLSKDWEKDSAAAEPSEESAKR